MEAGQTSRTQGSPRPKPRRFHGSLDPRQTEDCELMSRIDEQDRELGEVLIQPNVSESGATTGCQGMGLIVQ